MRKLLIALGLIAILLFVYAAKDVDLTGYGDKVLNYGIGFSIKEGEESKIFKDEKHIFTIKNNLTGYAPGIRGLLWDQFELEVIQIATGKIRKCSGTVLGTINNHTCELSFDDGANVILNIDPSAITDKIIINSMSITLGTQTTTIPPTPPTPAPTGVTVQPPNVAVKNVCQFGLKVVNNNPNVIVETLKENKDKITVLKKNTSGQFVAETVQFTSSFGFKPKGGTDTVKGLFYIFYLQPGQYKFQQSISSQSRTYPSGGYSYIEVTRADDVCKIYKRA